MYRVYILGMVPFYLPGKRPADKDSDGQHSGGMHGNAFGFARTGTVMYTSCRGMHRIYLLCLVCMRLKRAANEDSDR